MPYALCPMPYALCPIVPHLSEKGYTNILNSAKVTQKVVLRMNNSVFQVYEV